MASLVVRADSCKCHQYTSEVRCTLFADGHIVQVDIVWLNSVTSLINPCPFADFVDHIDGMGQPFDVIPHESCSQRIVQRIMRLWEMRANACLYNVALVDDGCLSVIMLHAQGCCASVRADAQHSTSDLR